MKFWWVGLASMAWLAAPIQAQLSALDGFTRPTMQPGSPAGSYNLSGFDTINPSNRNLNFSLVLHEVTTRGGLRVPITLPFGMSWQVRSTPTAISGSCGSGGCRFAFNYFPTENWWNNTSPISMRYLPGRLESRATADDQYDLIDQTNGYRLGTIAGITNSSVTATLPDRTEIEFRDAKTSGKQIYTTLQPSPNVGYERGRLFTAVDGSAATLILAASAADRPTTPPGSGPSDGTVITRDGTRVFYSAVSGSVSRMVDRNGNEVTFAYEASSKRLARIDSATEAVTFTYSGDSDTCVGFYDEINYQGTGGGARKIRVNFKKLDQLLGKNGLGTPYQVQTLSSLFAAPGGVSTPNTWAASTTTQFNKCFVSDVELPNGRKFKFQYTSHGMLARVELPTGGAYEYEYEPALQSLGGTASGDDPPSVIVKMPVKEKRIYKTAAANEPLESKITFSDGPGPSLYTDVKTLAGDGTTVLSSVRHYFYNKNEGSRSTAFPGWQDFKEYKTEELDAAGNVLRRTEQVWEQRPVEAAYNGEEFDGPGVPFDVAANNRGHDPRLRKSTVTWLEGSTKNSVTEFDYDRYNNQTEVREYGFGANGTPGSLLRRTTNTYWTDDFYAGVRPNVSSPSASPAVTAHIRGLTKTSVVKDGAGVQHAETQYYYDNMAESVTAVSSGSDLGAVADAAGVAKHDDAEYGIGLRARGNLTRTKRWTVGSNYVKTSRLYNTLGNVVSATDGRDNSVSYSYAVADGCGTYSGASASQAFVTRITYPPATSGAANFTEKYCWDYTLGRPSASEDANGLVTSYAYETLATELDRLRVVIRPDGGTTEYKYCDQFESGCDFGGWAKTGPAGPMVHAKTLIEAGKFQESRQEFDGLGREVESRQRLSPQDIVTTKSYDGLGRVRTASLPYYGNESSVLTQTSYDLLGRVTEVKNLSDNSVARTAHAANEATSSDAARANGETYGDRRKVVTDALGRIEQVVENEGGATPYSTYYRYSSIDKLLAVCQGAPFGAGGACPVAADVQQRVFAYDGMGRLLQAQNPESGSTAYSYDENSNLLTKTDADGAAVTTAYDALNRPQLKTYTSAPRTAPMTRFCYDGTVWNAGSGTCVAAAVSYAKARLTDVWTAGSRTRYTGFDAMGRILGSVQETGSVTFPFAYSYTYAGGLKTMQYPSGRVVTNGFDAAERITDVTAGSTAYASQLSYAAHGAMKQVRLGNGLFETWEHSAARLQPRRVALGSAAGGADKGSLEFVFCAGTTLYGTECASNNGNVMSQRIFAGAALTFTQTYTYDGVNRLKSANEAGGALAETYGHDRFGNMWLETPGSPGTNRPCAAGVSGCLHVSATTNRLDGAGYDAAGNRLGMGPMGLAYDAEGRVTAVTATGTGDAGYVYDGLGKRVKAVQTSGGTVLRETVFGYDAGGNLAAEVGPAVEASEAGTWYLTGDHLGSTRMMTRGAAEAVRRYDYAPYGEELAGSGRTAGLGYGLGVASTGVPRQKFTGHVRDGETGLDYFGARYYGGAMGRFTSADAPFADQRPEDPQSWNLYSYVRGNPLVGVDSDGRAVLKALKLLYKGGKAVYEGGSFLRGVAEDINSVSTAVQAGATSEEKLDGVKAVAGYVPLVGDAIDAYDAAKAVGAGAAAVAAYWGGRYGSIAGRGDGTEKHHAPADSSSPLSRSQGPAVQMLKGDHKETSSHSSQGAAGDKYRAGIKEQLDAGEGRKAMATEVKDVRRVARQAGEPRRYNSGLQQMLDYAKRLPLFKKK